MPSVYPANPQLIEKENIAELKFPQRDVLISPELIRQRMRDIERATLLGNNFKNKVRIIFEDGEGIKQVETTVWGFTDKRIILKGGRVIPIHRIYRIIS